MRRRAPFFILGMLVLLIAPFVIYHYILAANQFSMYSHFDQSPRPLQRALPPKEDQQYIRILSIDGGGVRGIIPLYVLKYFEEKSGKPISDLFDVVMGTSTGAIASVYLSLPGENNTPRYSVQKVLDIYTKMSKGLFFNPWYHSLLTLNGWIGPKYLSSHEYAIGKKEIGSLYFDQLLTNVIVPVYDVYNRSGLVFCNWNTTTRDSGNTNFSVADLLMGATAFPGIFPLVIFGSNGTTYSLADGGLFAYNPEIAAAFLAMETYPNKKYILVSLGTGEMDSIFSPKKLVDWGLLRWLMNFVPSILDSTSKFSDFLMKKSPPPHLEFFRLNTKISAHGAALDNVSHKNIQQLHQDGARLVNERKSELDAILGKLLKATEI